MAISWRERRKLRDKRIAGRRCRYGYGKSAPYQKGLTTPSPAAAAAAPIFVPIMLWEMFDMTEHCENLVEHYFWFALVWTALLWFIVIVVGVL